MPTAEQLLGLAAVHRLITSLEQAAPGLPLTALRECAATLAPKAFRERVDATRDALLADLPADYDQFAAIIRTALRDPHFTGWLIAPVAEAVTARALAASHPTTFDAGLALLADLTPRFTAEFAIRPFLAADLDRTLATVLTWTTHPDEHVRRLASEGTRPRLLAQQVPTILARPDSTLPILHALYRDPSEYVRRSVANHLNDLSRAHPDLTAQIATRWLSNPDENTTRLVRHALRTLISRPPARPRPSASPRSPDSSSPARASPSPPSPLATPSPSISP
ncbi:MAG: DNA alkylation repair protein [Chloroflexia bacterium]